MLFNSFKFRQKPIERNLALELANSSFIKFEVLDEWPNYIKKFYPKGTVEQYLYFSTEFKENMYVIVFRYRFWKEDFGFRMIVLSDLSNKYSDIELVFEKTSSTSKYFKIIDSCDRFLDAILRETHFDLSGKLLFHKSLEYNEIRITLNRDSFRYGSSVLIIPTFYEWLYHKYAGFSNKYHSVAGRLHNQNIEFVCGLENLSSDLYKIMKFEGIIKNQHYFISGDVHNFPRSIHSLSKGINIPNPNNPEFLFIYFGFDYYQGDNPRDGEIEFKIPLKYLDQVSSKIREREEYFKKLPDDDLPF